MRAVPLLLAAACLLLAAPASGAEKLHECQHPVVTGQEAYRLHNVSVKRACAFVRKLGRFVGADNGRGYARLYHCVYPKPDQGGYPVLNIHHLFNWKLRIRGTYEFVVYRGAASFSVTGTDFPLNCT